MLALSAWPGAVLAQDAGGASLPAHVVDKIDDVVLTAMAEAGSASFIVLMADQADLSRAYQLRSKEEKGRFVFETLRTTAEHSQAGLLAELKDRGVAHHSLYVVNAVVLEQGDLPLAAELAARSDVARLVANPTVQQPLPELEAASPDTSPEAIEWGVSNVKAPQVWSTYGVTGAGIVIAGQDTGIRWDHAALQNQYRGWDGASADHNYSWWDAIHGGAANPLCGFISAVPCDDNGHGTHTVGTVVGDGGVNVRSATRSSTTAYGNSSGTSMAGPHVVGVAALLWSAVPELIGQVPATEQYLRETAVKNVVGSPCGGGANTAPWNTWDNTYGWGRIDALAAIEAALCPADINYDDVIDVVDISLLASQWNLSLGDAGYNSRRDLNFDNTISVNDLVAVASQWQTRCSGS